MMLFGIQNVLIMWLVLIPTIGLTVWEAREQQLNLERTLWWVLLVILLHVVGYLAIRVWAARQGRQQ